MIDKKEESNRNKRNSTEDLLEEGLSLLSRESIQSLTIDTLCRRLGVTKGSFYHHFRNRADYLKRMLEHWVEVWTVQLMRNFTSEGSAAERYNRMINVAVNYPMDVEISIRAWGQQDSFAQEYIRKVDKMRIEYLRAIFLEICGDPHRAELLAKTDYMLFVGSRMVSPPVMGKEVQEILNLLRRELYHIPVEEYRRDL